MRGFTSSNGRGIAVVVWLMGAVVAVAQTTNTWTLAGSQTWGTGVAWSLGVPPTTSDAFVSITNAPTKTVTIDAATAALFPASLTLSNLTIAAPTGQLNILNLTTGGATTPLRVLGKTTISPGGFLVANHASLTVAGPLQINGTLHSLTGTLITTNSYLDVGSLATGSLLISNGVWRASEVYVGALPGANGTLTIAAGQVDFRYSLFTGWRAGATGTVFLTGGELVTTNSDTFIGDAGIGRITVSGGRWRALTGWLGFYAGARGELTVTGGTNTWLGALHLGSATSFIRVSGGALVITNSTGTAHLDVGHGQVTITGGWLKADRLVITNAAARFHRTGGLVELADLILNPTHDTDGDGLTNGFELNNGLDPLHAADAATHLRITGLTREGNHIRLTWETTGGQTNTVQTAPTPTGPFTNLTGPFLIPGTGLITTNHLDLHAATNQPARYYRLKR